MSTSITSSCHVSSRLYEGTIGGKQRYATELYTIKGSQLYTFKEKFNSMIEAPQIINTVNIQKYCLNKG